MVRSTKKVLNDTTNNTSNSKTKLKSEPKSKLDENQWRTNILSFYMYDKSLSSFLESNKLGRDPFRTRWEKSGLRELKIANTPYADAAVQYDFWFRKWKGLISKTKKNNGSKGHQAGFVIHDDEVDDDDDDDDDDIIESTKHGGMFDVVLDTESVTSNDDECADTSQPPKQPTTKKLNNTEIKDVLFEYYLRTDGTKLLTYIKEKGLLPNKKAITRHWKGSKLDELKSKSEPLVSAIESYDYWHASEKEKNGNKNKKNGSKEKALPVELEVFMREIILQLSICGQGIGKKALRVLFKEALSDFTSQDDDGDGRFSRSTIDRFLANYDIQCKNVKNIDPARVSQVTPENRDAFFFRLDQIIKLLHSIDDVNCPWKDWSEVAPEFKYNMDEMGSDPTKFRDLLLIPTEIMNRIFQVTPEGDRPSAHVSVAKFSRSDGKYNDRRAKIEGAPMPIVIHSVTSSKKKGKSTESAIEKRIELYNDQEEVPVKDKYMDGFEEHDDLGIKVCTTIGGSMTKELFLVAAIHFIENLPSTHGNNGKYSFLLLDSHVSRWNPKALYYLCKHRVIPIFFPSHLSIVVQPQDNGVIFFLHKCIEEAASIKRLFATETDISYSNRIMAKGFHLFREGERKKLLTRGSNSTTRSYNVTGMHPCNPYSVGWRENLELYASYNGVRMNGGDDECRYYGVRPKENNVSLDFSEREISMLTEAVPNLATDGTITVLNHSKAKCYAIADEIINRWIENSGNELHTTRPRAVNDVEKLALKHMDITQIVSAEPKSEESLLLDDNYNRKKRDAILTLTKPLEVIQVQPHDSPNQNEWFNAQKLRSDEVTWSVCDGSTIYKHLTTRELEDQYKINLSYNMFPNDNRLKETTWRSDRRRRNEKVILIQRIAKVLAEEERKAYLKEEFELFMALPKEKQTYNDFSLKLASKIEDPSNHVVTVQFGSEEHVIKVTAHGNNTSSMSQLVMDNVCRTIIGDSNRKERKKNKNRRGGRVNRVRRGSDVFVKSFQIDQQHINDLSLQEATTAKKKKIAIVLCKSRLKHIRDFQCLDRYDHIWNDDHSIQLQKLQKKNLVHLLRMFNVEGRARLLNNDPMREALSKLSTGITQSSIDLLKSKLLQELEAYGEEYDSNEDGILDSSFAGDSIADTSIVDTSIINTSIVDTSIIDIDETSGEENSAIILLESETSGGDAVSSSETDNTVEIDALIEGARKKKSVSFNRSPAIRTFSAYSSSSSSSSSDADINSPTQTRQTRHNRRCLNKRKTCASKRSPTTSTPPPPPLSPPQVVLRRSLRHH